MKVASAGAPTPQQAGAACLAATEVSFGFRSGPSHRPVLRNINVELRSGEMVAIVGANGCGKTTLLRVLAGLEQPASGSVHAEPSGLRIGFVLQSAGQNLLPWRTVLDNVSLPALLGGSDRVTATGAARGALADLELSELEDRYPQELSGGQQQLVVLARWKANPPGVLLVDEGWSMLDFLQRHRAYGLLRWLVTERNCAVAVVSHNLSEVAGVVDRAVVLSGCPASVVAEAAFGPDEGRVARGERLWATVANVTGMDSPG